MQVDAFTDSAFKGNPAAVCFLEEERKEEWLQAVATEFNVPVTCYLTRIMGTSNNPRFHFRYFTHLNEVNFSPSITYLVHVFLYYIMTRNIISKSCEAHALLIITMPFW